ncbi:type II toxin-antitoxin system RelE/ParE family toxin [Methylobacterium sp. WL6]|uniref:type II toxin-antitoxin system RelE/ParE family toxin n=1 Tax=Methylobacterium sp. WL6 TaxID=2603901 RepID=UPI0011CC6B20|nr:type II toxin-antitoxin system RelE/ParE family toxin [Methylobacterium sp. WL6]TXN62008.1 type II toxin-antitoxin system RelE/ParE family toxin [Methylobacterium sp. WL6]
MPVRRTADFDAWLGALRDPRAKARIAIRIDRLVLGNAGDAKPVGSGVSEMRIDYGPGYRLYFIRRGKALIVLLCGGDKGSQQRDIVRARALAADLKDGDGG